MGLRLITGPATEPVSADEAKAFLPSLAGASDESITAWIKAARQSLDGWAGKLGGRALITQVWELSLDAFPAPCIRGTLESERWMTNRSAGEIRLPIAPLQSVDSIKYDDADGVEQTVADGDYYTDTKSEPGWVFPVADVSWPTPLDAINSVRVRFTAGYGDDGDAVPDPIKQAILLQVSLTRSLMGQNLFIRSETVDGVGSTDYSGGTQASAAIAAEIDRLIDPYRLGCGIS